MSGGFDGWVGEKDASGRGWFAESLAEKRERLLGSRYHAFELCVFGGFEHLFERGPGR